MSFSDSEGCLVVVLCRKWLLQANGWGRQEIELSYHPHLLCLLQPSQPFFGSKNIQSSSAILDLPITAGSYVFRTKHFRGHKLSSPAGSTPLFANFWHFLPTLSIFLPVSSTFSHFCHFLATFGY